MTVDPSFIRRDPDGPLAPLLVDSPHSGNVYPDDFKPACAMNLLRQTEDTLVDDLCAGTAGHGAILIAARFPRCYIDANRSTEDIDPQLLASPWPGPVRQSDKGRVGMGLIRRVCRPGVAVYDRRLNVAEVQARIDHCYLPYHAALAAALGELQARFGRVWHLNCHSMPSNAGRSLPLWTRADFVLGDRDGTSSETAFTAYVADAIRRMGYTAQINNPYKGVEIVRRYGRPAEGINCLQVEINRSLYLDEETGLPNRNYDRLKTDLTTLFGTIRIHIEDQLYAAAAD